MKETIEILSENKLGYSNQGQIEIPGQASDCLTLFQRIMIVLSGYQEHKTGLRLDDSDTVAMLRWKQNFLTMTSWCAVSKGRELDYSYILERH